jgi:hypothetical protein
MNISTSFPRSVYAAAQLRRICSQTRHSLGEAGKRESSVARLRDKDSYARYRSQLDSRFRGNDVIVFMAA